MIDFELLRMVCKYYGEGFDEKKGWETTCKNKHNKPAGESWGICNIDNCPFLK